MPRPTQCLVAGSLHLRTRALVERLPAPGETLEAGSILSSCQGIAPRIAFALSSAGLATAILSQTGRDAAGHACLRELSRAGLGTRWIARSAQPTAIALETHSTSGASTALSFSSPPAAPRLARISSALAATDSKAWIVLASDLHPGSALALSEGARRLNLPLLLLAHPFPDRYPWDRLEIHTLITDEPGAAQLDHCLPPGATLPARNLILAGGSGTIEFLGEEDEFTLPFAPRAADSPLSLENVAARFVAARFGGATPRIALQLAVDPLSSPPGPIDDGLAEAENLR